MPASPSPPAPARRGTGPAAPAGARAAPLRPDRPRRWSRSPPSSPSSSTSAGTAARWGRRWREALLFLFGGVGYPAPVRCSAPARCSCSTPMLPSVRPFRAGAACLVGGLTLGLAAGTLGLGPGEAPRTTASSTPSYLEHHGGAVGRGASSGPRSTLFQEIGAHILFVFLLVAGVAAAHRRLDRRRRPVDRAQGVAQTTARLRREHARVRGAVSRGEPPDPEPAVRQSPSPSADRPPEVEPVVRATHVEAPALDASERVSRPLGEPSQEPRRRGAARGRRAGSSRGPTSSRPSPRLEEELTPLGNRRSAVTEADDFDWLSPKPGVLKRSSGKQKVSTGEAERVGRPAGRGARPLRRRGAGRRDGHRARTSRATSCGSRPASRCPRSPS